MNMRPDVLIRLATDEGLAETIARLERTMRAMSCTPRLQEPYRAALDAARAEVGGAVEKSRAFRA